MKKAIKWIVLGVVGVVVIALLMVWINLNSIVRSTVESQSTASLDLPTKVGGASVSIFGGSFSLSDFQIASPPGFKAPNMMTLGKAGIDVALSDLRKEPIHVKHITIDQPHVVIEANGTKLNFQALMERQSKTPAEPKSDKPTEPVKVIIDQIDVTGVQVALRPGLAIAGLKEEYAITVPSVSLKNVGSGDGSQNGAAIKDVVAQLLSAIAGEASKSKDLPADLQNLLQLNADAVAKQLGEQLNKQLGKVTDQLKDKLPGDLGTQLEKNLDGKDPGKALEKGVGDFLDSKKDKKKKDGATTKE